MRKAGINTVLDLVKYFPKEYICNTPTLISSDIIDEKNHFSITIANNPTDFRAKSGRTVLKFFAFDDNGTKVTVLYFNQPYLKASLVKGKRIEVYGELKFRNCEYLLVSPEKDFQIDKYSKYTPVYNPIGSISAKTVRKLICDNVFNCAREIEESVSFQLLTLYNLPVIRKAIVLVHYPTCDEDIYKSRQVFAIEKLVEFGKQLARYEAEKKALNVPGLNAYSLRPFEKKLPFKLTYSQKKVIADICESMYSQKFVPAINRLIQGDVGSGKTVVAAAISYIVAKNNKSTLIMAPTEILAEQHYKTFSKYFEGEEVKILLLTGSTPKKEIERILQITSSFSTPYILIGTHALISKDRIYRNVALTITDEQQRFGTIQRTTLNEKGNDCHSLVMTATPIPRSLAMFLNTENSISVIKSMPEGRKGIKTVYVGYDKKDRIYSFINEKIKNNQKAYFVCPMIEPNDEISGIISAKEQYEDCIKYFGENKVAFLNGKMKSSEKERIMDAFKNGDVSVLVSTTVIEVGIDVPEATVIVIMNAERLGLSQLHQLRGRVGRGNEMGYCVLVSSSASKNVRQRLNMLTNTSSGFEIAEYDLKMRGPGEFFGTQQSGFFSLPFTEVLDENMIKTVLNQMKYSYKLNLDKHPYQFKTFSLLDKIQ